MSCAFKLRSAACNPKLPCHLKVAECTGSSGRTDRQFPETMLGSAMSKAQLIGLSLFSRPITNFTSSTGGDFQLKYLCRHQKGARGGVCNSVYTPCTLTNVTQQQCEHQCDLLHACKLYAFGGNSCQLLQKPGRPLVSTKTELLCFRREPSADQSSPLTQRTPPTMRQALPVIALGNRDNSLTYDGVRNGWSGWWLRLTSSCDAEPSACSLWTAKGLLPAPKCPVNCQLLSRPSAATLQGADAVITHQVAIRSLPHWINLNDTLIYCIEGEAGSWRVPACPRYTSTVGLRPDATLRFSWFSRYYVPPPLSTTNMEEGLLSPKTVRSSQFRIESYDPMVPIISVWFSHCHVDPHNGMLERAAFLRRLQQQGLQFASYGKCMRNVAANDKVLSTDQVSWLPNKILGMRRHPFVLISENSAQPGWVTEKIYQAFAAGVVPVWFGTPPGWEEQYLLPIVPPNSVVMANKFPTIALLVEFLHQAINTSAVYRRFHMWRQDPFFNMSRKILARELAISFETIPCRICQLLHSQDPVKKLV